MQSRGTVCSEQIQETCTQLQQCFEDNKDNKGLDCLCELGSCCWSQVHGRRFLIVHSLENRRCDVSRFERHWLQIFVLSLNNRSCIFASSFWICNIWIRHHFLGAPFVNPALLSIVQKSVKKMILLNFNLVYKVVKCVVDLVAVMQ